MRAYPETSATGPLTTTRPASPLLRVARLGSARPAHGGARSVLGRSLENVQEVTGLRRCRAGQPLAGAPTLARAHSGHGWREAAGLDAARSSADPSRMFRKGSRTVRARQRTGCLPTGPVADILLCFGVAVAICVLSAGGVWAEDKLDAGGAVVRTDSSGSYRLPPDWPIEERGGIRSPIPTEEYLYRRFTAVEKQLQDLEQRVSGLDLRLRVWEEEVKSQKKGLRSTEGGS